MSSVENKSISGLISGDGSSILSNELHGLNRIESTLSNKENLKAVNPKYKTKAYVYQNNCGNCTVAYELRCRGYDVEALPSLGMAEEVLTSMFDGATVQNVASVSMIDVEQKLLAMGEGARGAIFGEYKISSTRHVFSFEVRKGKVIFHDGQVGRENVKELAKMEPLSIKAIRLDNTKPNDNILKAVKNREA